MPSPSPVSAPVVRKEINCSCGYMDNSMLSGVPYACALPQVVSVSPSILFPSVLPTLRVLPISFVGRDWSRLLESSVSLHLLCQPRMT